LKGCSRIVETARRVRPFLEEEGLRRCLEFVRDRWGGDGGFRGHTGRSDLYYTLFGVDCLLVLGKRLRLEPLQTYLGGFGGGEGLDLIHLGCLARCWTRLTAPSQADARLAALLPRLETERAQAEPSLYASFVVWTAYEEAGESHPRPGRLLDCVERLRCPGGGARNDGFAKEGATAPTAAAIVLESRIRGAADPRDVSWILERQCPAGGFVSHPRSPCPDLLSTAVSVYALREAGEDAAIRRMPCVDFVEGLWNQDGSFRASPWDQTRDVEYTLYGLLAMGGVL